MDKRNSTYRNNELEAKIRAQTLCFSAAFRRSFEPLKHAYRVASNFYGFSNYLKLAREVAMRKETSRASYKIVDKNKEYTLSSWISFTVSSLSNKNLTPHFCLHPPASPWRGVAMELLPTGHCDVGNFQLFPFFQ